MAGYSYFVCPVEFNNDSNRFEVDCEPSELFQLQDYTLPTVLASFTGWVRAHTAPIHDPYARCSDPSSMPGKYAIIIVGYLSWLNILYLVCIPSE